MLRVLLIGAVLAAVWFFVPGFWSGLKASFAQVFFWMFP